jgi:hypothetical protein
MIVISSRSVIAVLASKLPCTPRSSMRDDGVHQREGYPLPDGSDGPRFRVSDETRRRWWARRRLSLGLALAACAVFVPVIASSGMQSRMTVGVAIVGNWVALAGWYSVNRRRPGYSSQGALWAGLGSVHVGDIRSAGLTEGLRMKDRRLRFMTFDSGMVNALMEVREEGLSWEFGRLARFVGMRGRIRLPWSRVGHVEIGHVPGTIRGIGGGISITLDNSKTLDGQFVGSQRALRDALARSPFGLRAH